MKISFIGLGSMGGGMAANLARNAGRLGFTLQVINRSAEKCRRYVELGAQASTDNLSAADSDILFTCLPDTAAVKGLLLGDEGLLAHMKPGRIVVDCSTINYLSAVEIAQCFEKAGVDFMDAPISGHPEKAADGTLTIMCGGKAGVYEAIKPYLECMGTTILHMGPAGAGQLTKMINNCALDICAASFCELMPVGVKLGLDPEKLGTVLMTASGASSASRTLIPEVLQGKFDHGFTMQGAYKDLTSMLEVVSKYAIPLPTLAGTLQTYQLALQNGQGGLYKGAMIRFYEDMLGVKVRAPGAADAV